ncbi:MAG: hypothetical protein ACJAYY_000765 [Paraglaciecola sp.]|jgi:hypothetical protein
MSFEQKSINSSDIIVSIDSFLLRIQNLYFKNLKDFVKYASIVL